MRPCALGANQPVRDRLQLNRSLIQETALLILSFRLATLALTVALLVTCYWPNVEGASIVLGAAVVVATVFTPLSCAAYRSGRISTGLVVSDVVTNIGAIIVCAHYAENTYSPLLFILIIKALSYAGIFGTRTGIVAAIVAVLGVAGLALTDYTGVWPAATFVPAPEINHVIRIIMLMMVGTTVFFGSMRTMSLVRAKEEELSRETARAREAARFQTGLQELGLVVMASEGLDQSLRLFCHHVRRLLGCAAVRVSLLKGDRLTEWAVDPPEGPRMPDPMDVAGVAARERRAVWSETPGEPRGEVALALPLFGRNGRVLGALTCVDSCPPADMLSWEARLQLVAPGAAVIVERTGLIEELQRETRQVRALLKAAREISKGGASGDVAQTICRVTREVLEADHAALLRFDAQQRLIPSAQDGLTEEEWKSFARLSMRIDQNPESIPAPFGDIMRVGRLAFAPILHGARMHGLLVAWRTTTPGVFGGAHLALLTGIASQAGLAQENVRLLRKERDAAALANRLLDVARELNLALDLRSFLSRVAARAAELTQARVALISIWNVKQSCYQIEAVHGLGPADTENVLNAKLAAAADDGAFGVELVRHIVAGPDGERPHDVSVPMERGGTSTGVLTLVWSPGHEPTQQQMALAVGLANQAAIALENIRLVEDLREADRLKSEFVATMSHELRTPLNVILGYADLLLEEGFGKLDDEQRGVIARVQRSAHELFELITDTLNLNRIESGRERVNVSAVRVADLFAQIELEQTARLENSDVVLRFVVGPELTVIHNDQDKLKLILRNLVGNAIKFTEHGSVTVRAEIDGEQVVFTVSDTGIGIRPEDLPVIFDMFRQVESANTRRHGGVGLGLYIVKRYLTLLRGTVEVESEVGVGTRFRIRMPARLSNEPVSASEGDTGARPRPVARLARAGVVAGG